MGNKPVIAAVLESEEGLKLLDHEILSPKEATDLGYGRNSLEDRETYREYRDRRLETGAGSELFDYHSLAQELISDPLFLYDEGLLEDEVYENAAKDIHFLDANRDRPLNRSELEAVVSTAMKEEDFFPKKALDKEEFVDRVYVGLYSSLADTPPSAVSEDESVV
ncbi:MAG: hypothetical protein ABEK04_00345 [Candidatus Nanohalobium sp.]